jgi:hypothetical protein
MTNVTLILIKNHRPTQNESGGTQINVKRKRNMAVWQNNHLLEIILAA